MYVQTGKYVKPILKALESENFSLQVWKILMLGLFFTLYLKCRSYMLDSSDYFRILTIILLLLMSSNRDIGCTPILSFAEKCVG